MIGGATPLNIVDISKNIEIRHNVSIRVLDASTGKVVQEHTGHNAATNSMFTGIAHYLSGDGVFNQGYSMLSAYVPRYISLGTMGLLTQEQDNLGLPCMTADEAKEYMSQCPGYGADGYDTHKNNNRPYSGLGPVFKNRQSTLSVNCELISDSFPRALISYREIIPETRSEFSETVDVVFGAMISTGALAQFRESDKDYIFISEVGLWSEKEWTEGGSNGLLAGYRIIPPNEWNWGMSPEDVSDDDARTYLRLVEGEVDPSASQISECKPAVAAYNLNKLQQSILKVKKNQVVQVVWKLQLGGIKYPETYISQGTIPSNAYRKSFTRNFVHFPLVPMPELPNFGIINNKIDVVTDGYTYKYQFDIEKYKNTGGTTYYVAPGAPGHADRGLSEDSPVSLQALLTRTGTAALADGDTIVLADGIYRDIVAQFPQDHYACQNSLNFIAKNPGKVTIANIGAKLTYQDDGDGIYSANRSSVVKVVQLLDADNFVTTELQHVETVADCNQAGTWTVTDSENNAVLHLHLFGGIEPTHENCFVLLNYHMPVFRSVNNADKEINLYLDGINFIGGTNGTLQVRVRDGSTYATNVYARSCKFLHTYSADIISSGHPSGNAVQIYNANAFFVNCYAGFATQDGFNYHISRSNPPAFTPSFIEVNCIGANNGVDGVAQSSNPPQPSQNGSTSHDGVKGLRIGGVYYNNFGPNVADVNDNTVTVNIQCTAFDSANNGPSSTDTANADFSAQMPGSTMYCYSCRAFGSRSPYIAATGATIITHNCETE